MTDGLLNSAKPKRPYITPESMKKYAMDKKDLKALRAEHQARIEELESTMDKESSFHAANAIRYSLIAESKFQIKMIDALL